MPIQAAEINGTADTGNGSVLQRAARRLLIRSLTRLEHGCIRLVDGSGVQVFGDGGSSRRASIHVADNRFYTRVLTGGTTAAGEALGDGDWSCDDLVMLVRIFVANRHVLEGLDGAWVNGVRRMLDRYRYHMASNTESGSARNIAAHYDLSNDFFALWLDARMMYSSARFDGAAGDDLDSASERKLAAVCDKLDLQPGDSVLEIGSGWGGLALYMAHNYDVSVTTITISQSQYDMTSARVREAGLDDRIDVRKCDYRKIDGSYDKVVSVEMVEAVGDQFVDGYFKVVERLLKPGGRFVMQAITIQDQLYAKALRDVDFIKRHIFPGSFIPSVSRLLDAARSTASLRLTALDDFGPDYAKTLTLWSKNFSHARRALLNLGFDDRFQRMWQFYFAYCAGGFEERSIGVCQAVFENAPVPLAVRGAAHD